MQTMVVPSLLMIAGVICVIGLAHGFTAGQPKILRGTQLEPSTVGRAFWRLQMVGWLLGAVIAFVGAAVLWS